MSLVNQFEITLKDFLPDRSDGMIITDRTRRTTTTVSNRLYARLKAYADDNQLPFHSVVEQLRKEIHQPPVATIDPTASQQKFTKGDRVKLSAKGIEMMPRMAADRSGTVAFNHTEGKWVAVLWDGTCRSRYMNPHLLERSND